MAIPSTLEELFTQLYTYEYGDNNVSLNKIKTTKLEDCVIYKLEVKVQVGDDEPYFCPVEYRIPLFMRGSVSIPGNNGREKNRIQIYVARPEPVAKVTKSGVSIGFNPRIYVDYNNYLFHLGWDYSYNLLSVAKHFGVLEELFPEADTALVPNLTNEEIKVINDFTIDEKAITKIQVLFATDKRIGNKISAETLRTINTMYKDRERFDKMTPFDYVFMDAIAGLIYEIWVTHRQDLISYTRFNILKNEAIYPTKLQHIIDNYYNMQSKTFHDVQVPQDSNAISLMTQTRKIYFFDKDMQRKKMYNNYFAGVLDPNKTTEGANININNELSFGCELKDNKLYLKVLDKNFKELELSYEDFIMAPILAFDNIDYFNKTIHPNANGKYTYCQYGQYKYTDNPDRDIKYYRSLDTEMSASTGIIPFVNQMENNRTFICSHFIDQSIPVVGAKPPIVATIYGKKIYNESSMNIRSPIAGTVTAILDDEHVKIKNLDGEERVVSSARYANTSDHTTNEMLLAVKVGDKVKKDDVIFYMNSFVDGEFTTGVPLRTMFGTYEGRGYEDGIIISESAAKLLGHQRTEEVTKVLRLPTNSNVYVAGGSGFSFLPYQGTDTQRYDMFGLIKEGQKVKSGDTLFEYEELLAKDSSYAVLREAILNDPTAMHTTKFRCPFGINEGVVRSANIFFQYEDPANKDVTNYYKNKYNDKVQRVKDFTGKDSLPIEFEEQATYAIVKVEIDYIQEVVLTDKFSNNYGSKGVSTFIIPDSERPIDEWGNPIDLVIHSFSQYSRGNPAQTREAKLGLIGKDGYDWAVKKGAGNKEVLEFLRLAYPNEKFEGKEDVQKKIDEGSKYGYFRFITSPVDDIYTTERMVKLLDMIDRPMAESKMYLPKYKRWTETKASIGMVPLMRLHFIANNKLKATGALSNISEEFVLGYGSHRDEGQRIGLQETWAWHTHGKGKELAEIFQETGSSDKASKVLSTFLALGLNMQQIQ